MGASTCLFGRWVISQESLKEMPYLNCMEKGNKANIFINSNCMSGGNKHNCFFWNGESQMSGESLFPFRSSTSYISSIWGAHSPPQGGWPRSPFSHVATCMCPQGMLLPACVCVFVCVVCVCQCVVCVCQCVCEEVIDRHILMTQWPPPQEGGGVTVTYS